MEPIPASFVVSYSLCVIIPSKMRYFMPDWSVIFLTRSLMGVLNISEPSSDIATASSEPFIDSYIFETIDFSGLSSVDSVGFSSSPVMFFATGSKISDILSGVSSSTSIPGSACSSTSMRTSDFNSFSMNPPARSPSRNATTFSFFSHRPIIDSSIFAPWIAIALSYPERSKFMISALPSTSIIHVADSTPEPHGSFDGPYDRMRPAPPSCTSFNIVSPSLIAFVFHLRCKFSLVAIDDVRAAKRDDIVKRAKEIKRRWKTKAISEGDTMLKDVHEGGAGRIRSYGPSKLPCGSGVESATWIILVEGRADIINLLRSGYDNAIAIQGAKIDESIIGLCEKKEKVVAFLDGDRAGGFILKELKSLVRIDVELQADPGIEVEELTPERISEILDPVAKNITGEEEKPTESTEDSPLKSIVSKMYESINGSLEAVAISDDGSEMFRTPISDLVKKITDQSGIKYLILDGIITQRLYDTTKDAGIGSIVGHRIANVTSDSEMILKTFSDLGIES